MKNKYLISFVQPNFRQGPGGVAAYLPYSSGLLWAHAQTSAIIKNNLKLDRLIYDRQSINDLSYELSKNKIVAFSTYVWNRNYNFKLAKQIKTINPNVFIVFGGPEPPITNKEIFSSIMPFVDVIVKGEGEFIFTALLESLILNRDISQIKGLLINDNGNIVNTGDGVRINNLDEVPSPYLTGVFDQILPLEKEWNGTLETNRGCPYKCTFCDWGSLTYSKVKKFGLDRVFCELEWMSEKKIGYLDVADANFGIFLERDSMIIDKLIEVQRRNGYPYRTGWSWAKNQQSEVVKIAKKLINSGHFNNGLTISLQSMDENTLKTIKRSNMGINKINEIFDECRTEGIPLNVELIVGLPGETLNSWENTLYNVFEVGQHDSIEVWQAQILENAEMNLSQRVEYSILGQKVSDYFPNSINDEAAEYSEIVTQTSTMTLDEMVEAYKLSWFLITWHTGGFSQYIARFLRKYLNISYKEFYTDFRKFLKEDSFWKSEEDYMTKMISDWYNHGNEIKTKMGPITITASTMQYRTIFLTHYEEKHEYLYSLIETYIKKYNLGQSLFNDLTKLNRCLVAKQKKLLNYSVLTEYNIYQYITNKAIPLKHEHSVINVKFKHDPIRSKDLAWFMESIFFARRRSYGKNYLTYDTHN